MNKVVMASVYLDKGEGLDYLQAQVKRMAAQDPEYYFIDFICKEEQVLEATDLLRQFYMMVGEHLPKITASRVFAAVTCEEDIRPAAMALAFTTRGSDFSMLDVNPDRKR
jgi:hypothetical protein